jgi:hypothetical protein
LVFGYCSCANKAQSQPQEKKKITQPFIEPKKKTRPEEEQEDVVIDIEEEKKTKPKEKKTSDTKKQKKKPKQADEASSGIEKLDEETIKTIMNKLNA